MKSSNFSFKAVATFSLVTFILLIGLGIKMLSVPEAAQEKSVVAGMENNPKKQNEGNKAIELKEQEEKAEQERLALEKTEKEKQEAERLASEKALEKKAEADKKAAQKASKEKAAREKAAAEKKVLEQKAQVVQKSNDVQNKSEAAEKPAEINTQSSVLPKIPDKYSYKFLESVEKEILKYVNIERGKTGAKALTWNDTLKEAARYKANEMLQYNYFKYESSYTGNPWDVAEKLNYSYNTFGENLYMSEGYKEAQITAENIVTSWMNSPGHKANILNPKFGKMGAGAVYSSESSKLYVSQMFSN